MSCPWKSHLLKSQTLRDERDFFGAMRSITEAFTGWEKAYLIENDYNDDTQDDYHDENDQDVEKRLNDEVQKSIGDTNTNSTTTNDTSKELNVR